MDKGVGRERTTPTRRRSVKRGGNKEGAGAGVEDVDVVVDKEVDKGVGRERTRRRSVKRGSVGAGGSSAAPPPSSASPERRRRSRKRKSVAEQ